jgi:Mu-like prophage FluMu N-terminal domain
MIRIISKKEGFRRCGAAHSETPKDYANDHFTQKELKRLKNEPMLIVQELPDPPEEKKAPPKKSAKDKK